MKKIFIVLLLLIITTTLSLAQTIEKNSLYTVVYSESHQQPLTLTYKYPSYRFQVLPEIKPFALYSGKIEYPDPTSTTKKFKVPTNIITSDDEDYKDNIYDKGHLAPNKSFENNNEVQEYLFSYLNCALMHETLNRGVWKQLEDYERELSRSENVKISIILSFSNESKLVSGGATVPTHFTKIIEYGMPLLRSYGVEETEITREVYTFPNSSIVKGKKINEFKVNHLSGNFTNTNTY